MRLLVARHRAFAAHRMGAGHPERPERLDAVADGLALAGLGSDLEVFTPRPATPEELGVVHTRAYLDGLERLDRVGGGPLDPDTTMGPGSWEAAQLAAGAGIDAAARLEAGEADAAFCAVRPPGHHARPATAMGFCLLNNVAITAAALAEGGQRVAIVDIDAHHGNGTQEVFWDDPRVLYVSLHQWPLYPGTGAFDERGGAGARGGVVNLPLPPGATGDVYRAALDDVVLGQLAAFAPQWLLLSVGYDAHRRDPLTDLGLTSGDYATILQSLVTAAPAGRCVAFLEGGYDLAAVRDGVAATAAALVGAQFAPEAPTEGGPGRDLVARAAAELDSFA